MRQFKVMYREHGSYGNPIPNCPQFVPWDLVAPHESQAKRTHDQSLARLNERGGLSICELAAVLEDRPWKQMSTEAALEVITNALRARERREGGKG